MASCSTTVFVGRNLVTARVTRQFRPPAEPAYSQASDCLDIPKDMTEYTAFLNFKWFSFHRVFVDQKMSGEFNPQSISFSYQKDSMEMPTRAKPTKNRNAPELN